MQVTSKWIDGMCFADATVNGHSIVMEGMAAEGEVRHGPNPMEMLLSGMAGCSSIDVVTIAEKQRRKIIDCHAEVAAKRADAAPRVFAEIHIHFKVYGQGLQESAIEHAIQMSTEKYCSASIMLGKAAKMGHSFEIAETE